MKEKSFFVNRRNFFYTSMGFAITFLWGRSNIAAPSNNWNMINKIKINNGLKVFWDILTSDRQESQKRAVEKGFEIAEAINPYADYVGKQRRNIYTHIKNNPRNPWAKPIFFEEIVRKNIESSNHTGSIIVHDIEFDFDKDILKAWGDAEIRKASKASSLDEFTEKYYKEWSSWYHLPCQWSKQMYPQQPVGLYGPQVFNRDYWGFTKPSGFSKAHEFDIKLWKYIDQYIDFYVSSNYVFYDTPGSIYYVAANVEQNYLRSKQFGNKPIYSFVWLRYHSKKQEELADYLTEALAIIPFFSGSKGIVLWGWEPNLPSPGYKNLPLFVNNLNRLELLSSSINSAELVIDEPADISWKKKHPLVRKLKINSNEWLIMAVNPWQGNQDTSSISVECDNKYLSLEIQGKHTEVYYFHDNQLERLKA
jgi:hypothetical protein